MVKYFIFSITLLLSFPNALDAHRSGCHRWHSCPSDSGSYICGDTGHCSQCPNNQYCDNAEHKLKFGTSSKQSKVIQNNLLKIPGYNRNNWPHWIDQNNDCQNTRHEILIRDSNKPVSFKTSKGCKVISGKWIGPYTGQTFNKASDLDIDHIVPLAHAYKNGGSVWSSDKKMAFANDLDNLLAVDDSTNQSKGSKGPDKWMPPKEDYWCNYLDKWTMVKTRYALTISQKEKFILKEFQKKCALNLD
jgi:hypothetical protein